MAGTLFAARAGAALLAGNVNGFEHAADLCAVIPALQLKMGAPMVAPQTLAGLTTLSRAVDEQGNAPHRNNQPFVGQSAFAHKGGIHVAAVLKNEDSYQHIDPKVTPPPFPLPRTNRTSLVPPLVLSGHAGVKDAACPISTKGGGGGEGRERES